MKFKVVENSVLARIARFVRQSNTIAVTFGKYIHLSGVGKEAFLKEKRWVKHELEHVRQYQHFGFFRFIFLYLLESAKKGYYMNKFEVEARAAELKHEDL